MRPFADRRFLHDRSTAGRDRASTQQGDITHAHLRRECLTSLKRVIKAYLELHSICFLGTRSWVGIQRTVSATFPLAVEEESRQDPKVHSLFRDREAVISEHTRWKKTVFDTAEVQSPPLNKRVQI